MFFIIISAVTVIVCVLFIFVFLRYLKNKDHQFKHGNELYELRAEQETVLNEIRINKQIIRDSQERLKKIPARSTEYKLVAVKMIESGIAVHLAEDRLEQLQTKYRELIDPY